VDFSRVDGSANHQPVCSGVNGFPWRERALLVITCLGFNAHARCDKLYAGGQHLPKLGHFQRRTDQASQFGFGGHVREPAHLACDIRVKTDFAQRLAGEAREHGPRPAQAAAHDRVAARSPVRPARRL